MRSLFHFVAWIATIGFISFLAVSPIGICMLLILKFWKGEKSARVYYGIAVLLLSVALTLLFGGAVWDVVKHPPVNRGQLAIYVGAYVGIVGGLWNLLREVPHRTSKPSLDQPSPYRRNAIQTLLDRFIFLLSWVGIAMLIIDRVFFAPKGAFLVNFTWLSEVGLILYAGVLALLALRRVCFKPGHAPRWNEEKK